MTVKSQLTSCMCKMTDVRTHALVAYLEQAILKTTNHNVDSLPNSANYICNIKAYSAGLRWIIIVSS